MKRILPTVSSIAAMLLLLFLIIGHSTPRGLDERAEEAVMKSEVFVLHWDITRLEKKRL